jgi:hypothetical protein
VKSLIERVQDLRVAAAASNDENQIRSRTGDLTTLAERVEQCATAFPRLAAGLGELRRVGIRPASDLVSDATQVVATMGALANTLQSLPLDAPLDGPRAQVKQVESFIKSVNTFVEDAWAELRDRDTSPINETLVEALARSGLNVDDIRNDMTRAQTTLFVLANRKLPESGDVAKLEQARESLRSCGERISKVVDPSLAALILGAQDTLGMPLSRFTSEVLAALHGLGILDRFRVTLC